MIRGIHENYPSAAFTPVEISGDAAPVPRYQVNLDRFPVHTCFNMQKILNITSTLIKRSEVLAGECMATIKDLLMLAERIKDHSLRGMVADILKNPSSLSNPDFKAKPSDIEKVPASIDWHHTQEGGLLKHTLAVTLHCIGIAENMQRVYKSDIDMDSLIAAALVHDIGKVWMYRKTGSGWEPVHSNLDHTMLAAAELYARGFPGHVIHIVAAHFGENGPTPPMTGEAMILHAADNLDANLNEEDQKMVQLILG